jgi:Acetyltransferase (GNAT) domain
MWSSQASNRASSACPTNGSPEVLRTPPSSVRVGGHDLEIRDVSSSDRDAVLALHRRVFGTQFAHDWFMWKYGATPSVDAVGAWAGHELIAFCGALSRVYIQGARQTPTRQIGDVMVDPGWRGVLTRRGQFYQVSSRLYGSPLATDEPSPVAFGFPNQRHMELAMLLKLVWYAGPIWSLSWPSVGSRPFGWAWDEVSPADVDMHVLPAWSSMRREANDGCLLGTRDPGYIRWRYAQRPGVHYRFYRIRHRWLPPARGVAVVRETPDALFWLDWIGPRSLIRSAGRACQAIARQLGAPTLTAWASEAVAARVAPASTRTQAAWLTVARASGWSQEQSQTQQWWLMGGDTDFL